MTALLHNVGLFVVRAGLCLAPFVVWYLLMTNLLLLAAIVAWGAIIWLLCFDD